MNKKKLHFDDFEITRKRYKELCAFCEQYPEWKEKLRNATFIQAVKYDDEPKPSNHENSDTTAKHALRMLKMKRDCELIERVAKQACPDNYECIIKAVCYEVSSTYLINWEHIPMSRSTFYEKRRYFFYLLDLEKKHEAEKVAKILELYDQNALDEYDNVKFTDF